MAQRIQEARARLEKAKVPLFLSTGIKGREMRYEFACVVADSPGPDQEPPLPRFWEDRKAPPLVDTEPDGLFNHPAAAPKG